MLNTKATVRDFSGGLNVADSEQNLSSKYARELTNLVVDIDGSIWLRQGTKLFADIAALSDYPISNVRYFVQYLIAVNTRGEVFAVDARGTVAKIWDAVIANALRPGLGIWGAAKSVAFEEAKGELIIANGMDKPLSMTSALRVDYLADLGTGSNINVPVGLIMKWFANHLFIADGYTLHVSERNAAGTYDGDPSTQFTNTFDMRSYVSTGDTEIIALHPFKNFLLVCFREVVVPIQIVEDATATPKLALNVSQDSIINNYGSFSYRTAEDLGSNIYNCDIVGVSEFSLSTFTKILSPDRPSRFIDPLLQPAINKLSVDSLLRDTFSVYDRRLAAYMLFMPNAEAKYQTESLCFNYRYLDKLKISAWSVYRGWNWHAATRSSEGNVFYARNNCTKIFVQGDRLTNPLWADFIGEQETFDDNTYFTDGTGFGPVANVNDSGLPIEWAWELPEADFKSAAQSKTLRYIALNTEGTEAITCKVFVDGQYYAQNLVGEAFSDDTLFTDGFGFYSYSQLPITPALTLEFIARDAGGYGLQQYGNSPYGGGNNTGIRTLTYAPTKFNTMKLRFSGRANGPLRFVSITPLYMEGTIRRLL